MISKDQYRALKELWFDTIRAQHYSMRLAEKWWNALEQATTSKHRKFHNFEHIFDMITDLDYAINYGIGLTVRDFNLLTLVMFMHDIGYDPRDDLWEEKSAQLWTEFADCLGMPENEKMTGYHLILGLGDLRPYDIMSTVFYDAELLIYSEPPYKYNEFSLKLRQEFIFLNDAEYKAERLAFLEELLSRPAVYSCEISSDVQKEIAKHNIEREVSNLKALSAQSIPVTVSNDWG